MRTLRVFLATAFLLAVATNADAAKKLKNGKPVNGTVTSVMQDGTKDEGTFTLKVAGKKGAPAPAGPEEKTFKVTSATKLEMLNGKAKDAVASPAKFSDLSDGKKVTVIARGDTAESVKISAGKKAKKNKKKKNV